MNSFADTSKWEKKNATTLVYSYEHEGKKTEGSSEKEPQSVDMQLQRLSVLRETLWHLKNDEKPDSEPGFITREYISGLGLLDNCRLHAISLDTNPNISFSKLTVSIYPAPISKLQETSTADEWKSFRQSEKPELGWLTNELGRIDFHGEGEYFPESTLSARVFLAHHDFDQLSDAIRRGGVTSARIRILADVFHFGYESLGAGIPGHLYNYAILCEDEGRSVWNTPKGVSGHTNARLQELLLEWSPALARSTASRRDEQDDVGFSGTDQEDTRKRSEYSLVQLIGETHAVRARLEKIYMLLILVVAFLLLNLVAGWF